MKKMIHAITNAHKEKEEACKIVSPRLVPF